MVPGHNNSRLDLGPWRFCPWDVVSLKTFCPLGRSVPWDALTMRRFVLERFFLRTFCLGIGPSITIGETF